MKAKVVISAEMMRKTSAPAKGFGEITERLRNQSPVSSTKGTNLEQKTDQKLSFTIPIEPIWHLF